MMSYERLTAWRAAHTLAVEIYKTTQAFPKSELYGLTSQMRRASFSIPANIAEGAAKRGSQEFRRYLDIALGSFSELSYALRFAHDVGLLDEVKYRWLESQRIPVGKLVWGLYEWIARSARNRRSA